MAVGRIISFNMARGFGFIAPDSGGEDVFVHADELAEGGVSARTGARVDFEIIDTQRGLKAFNVRPSGGAQPAGTVTRPTPVVHEDADGELCDAIPSNVYASEITDDLISVAPVMTAGQIVEIRDRMIARARTRGWLVD